MTAFSAQFQYSQYRQINLNMEMISLWYSFVNDFSDNIFNFAKVRSLTKTLLCHQDIFYVFCDNVMMLHINTVHGKMSYIVINPSP